MSSTVRTATPTQVVNEYTVVVGIGYAEGVSEGDQFLIEINGDTYEGRVVDVAEERSVVELLSSDIKSYMDYQ